jgi:hypothetical protein
MLTPAIAIAADAEITTQSVAYLTIHPGKLVSYVRQV